jgi:hypothetical protein
LFAGLVGCKDAEPKPELMLKTYIDKQQQFALHFKNEQVEIVTPMGSMNKSFKIVDGHIEMHYADLTGKFQDIHLKLYQDELKTKLYCKRCAMFSLPSQWYLDVGNAAKL